MREGNVRQQDNMIKYSCKNSCTTTIGAQAFIFQSSSCTGDDIVQPSGVGRIGCSWLFHPLHLRTARYLNGYVFGFFQSLFHEFDFHTSNTCYIVHNTFLIMQTDELHTLYVHITSHDQ